MSKGFDISLAEARNYECDKVLVTTQGESIQKQLPIKRSSQHRGVQIFLEEPLFSTPRAKICHTIDVQEREYS